MFTNLTLKIGTVYNLLRFLVESHTTKNSSHINVNLIHFYTLKMHRLINIINICVAMSLLFFAGMAFHGSVFTFHRKNYVLDIAWIPFRVDLTIFFVLLRMRMSPLWAIKKSGFSFSVNVATVFLCMVIFNYLIVFVICSYFLVYINKYMSIEVYWFII